MLELHSQNGKNRSLRAPVLKGGEQDSQKWQKTGAIQGAISVKSFTYTAELIMEQLITNQF